MRDLLAQGKIIFGKDHNKIIELKVYAKDYLEKLPSVIELDGRVATYELRDIFPEQRKAFDNPKPTQLVGKVLSFATTKDSVVLDSFAGSGTTAHAVLNLNKQDEGNRRSILVECEEYADNTTAERVRRIIQGVPSAQEESLKSGLGGTFTYCTLDAPIELDKVLSGETLPSYAGIGAVLFNMATNRAFDPATIREADFYLSRRN